MPMRRFGGVAQTVAYAICHAHENNNAGVIDTYEEDLGVLTGALGHYTSVKFIGRTFLASNGIREQDGIDQHQTPFGLDLSATYQIVHEFNISPGAGGYDWYGRFCLKIVADHLWAEIKYNHSLTAALTGGAWGFSLEIN